MDAGDYIKFAEALKTERAKFEGGWNELRRLIMPRFSGNADPDRVPDSTAIHSDVANSSLQRLAAAHVSYITPMDKRWFRLQSYGKKDDELIKDWYNKATEQVEIALSVSNFYSVVQEVFVDRCLTGTGVMWTEINDMTRELVFRHIPTGTYAIAENSYGEADTLVRWFRMTAAQAVGKYGLDAVGDKISKAWHDDKKKFVEMFEFIHIVRPRANAVFGFNDIDVGLRKFEDITVCVDDRKVVESGGLYEFPYLVTRFLKWGDSAYGCAPGWHVRHSIRQSLDLNKMLYQLGQIAVYPRIMQLAEDVGEIDFRAGGVTVVSRDAIEAGLAPKEWMSNGRYQEGDVLLDKTDERIRQAFFVDMLETISQVERQMTATEVAAREGEKAMAFSASFVQFVSDFRPMMYRIVCLLIRAGVIDEPPAGVVQYDREGKRYELQKLNVQYLGKIAQAVARTQQEGLAYSVESLAGLSNVFGPEVLDIINVRKLANEIWDKSGAPQSVKAEQSEMDEKKAQRDAQQQAMMEAQLQEQMAGANRNNAQAQQAMNQ